MSDRRWSSAFVANSLLRYIHSPQDLRSALRLAESGGLARVLLETALSLWCRAHFRTLWSLFVAGARETSRFGVPKSTFRDHFSCYGGLKSTFRDRCRFRGRRSTLDMVVHGLWGALFLWVSHIVAFGHVARFQKSEEVSSESRVLASWCCVRKCCCCEMPWQGCAMWILMCRYRGRRSTSSTITTTITTITNTTTISTTITTNNIITIITTITSL